MENKSGFYPIDYNVLLSQEAPQEKTAGGLYLTDSSKDREAFSDTRGCIVALSPMAFAHDDWPDGAPKPQIGDWVRFAQHEGDILESANGDKYRMVKDRSILAVEDRS